MFYGTIAIGCMTFLVFKLNIERLNTLLFSPAVQCAAIAAVVMIITAFHNDRKRTLPRSEVDCAGNVSHNPKSAFTTIPS